jgi:hypothetical protein
MTIGQPPNGVIIAPGRSGTLVKKTSWQSAMANNQKDSAY